MQYDAFISYNHGADGGIAPYLQDALQRIAMPWYRRRGMAVFRDSTDLPADADLAEVIEAGLDDSRYYVLIASPGSRGSKWVGQEIDHWLATKTAARKRIVLVLTDGRIDLDDAQQIDYDTSTALHEQMRGRFAKAPLYIDLSTARQKIDTGTLSRRQFRREYRHDVALVAAKVKEVAVRDVIDEDAKFQHRKLILAWSAVAMLLVLAAASIVGFVSARNNAAEARAQARNARSLGLASQSSSATGQDAPQALALALASQGQASTEIGHRALQTAVASPIWRVYGPAVRQSAAFPVPTAMSPQGRLVAAGKADDHVKVWDSADGANDVTLGAPGTVTASSLAFAPDEQRLAATFVTGPAKGSDAPRGRLVIWQRPDTRPSIERDTTSPLVAVAYAPDGGTVAAGDSDGNVRLWDPDGNGARVIATGFPSVTTVSFSPDSRFVAATTEGDDRTDTTTGNVVVIDAASGERVVIPVGTAQVFAGAYSAGGTTFFTGDGDGNVRSWDLASGALLKSWTDSGPVQSIAVSPVAPVVVSGDQNGEVVVRDTETGLERSTWNEGTLVTSVGFDASGGRLETGNDRGRITIRDTSLLPNVFDTGGAVESLAMAAGGDIISYSAPAGTGSTAGGELKILHRATNTSKRLVVGARPAKVTVNPEGTFAAYAEVRPAADGSHVEVTTVDLATQQVVASWNVEGTMVDLSLPDETTLLGVVERDGEDHLLSWDLTGKEPTDDAVGQLAPTDATQTVGSRVAFTGSKLLIADAEQGIIVQDLDATRPHKLNVPGTTTYGIVVSRDGTKVASFVSARGADAATEVDIWDLQRKTVEPVTTNTRGATPTAAAFTRDGTKLAVGDDKSRVTLYDLTDLHQITEWDVSGAVTSVAFSPDGTTLAAADDLGHVEAWGSSSWQSSDAALAATLCRRLAGYHPIPADWAAVDPYTPYRSLCPGRR